MLLQSTAALALTSCATSMPLMEGGAKPNILFIMADDLGTELLEGGLRVPLIVRWPGVSRPGSICNQTVMSMDFAATLVAAGGASPHPDFPFDGIDLRPAISGATPILRKLFFRYLHLEQQAYRNGDWKYLKIAENTFLFNVANDPLERANLKALRADVFAQMIADYKAWEATMLPLDPAAQTHGYPGDWLADHFSSGH